MSRRPRISTPARIRAPLAAALALALGFSSACGEIEASKRWPEGAALVADTNSLERLLAQLARFEQTPLARRAEQLRAALPGCPVVESHAASGELSDLWRALACFSPSSELGALASEKRGRDLAFSLPGAGAHWIGSLALIERGDVELELRLPNDAARGAFGLALPGAEPAGAAELSASNSLIHARVRPHHGLDLASLVPADSQGDRLFRLKSELFTGVALDGVWEIAVYLPDAGEPMPPTALALDFTRRAAAIAAMEDFIRRLQEQWPVARTDFELGAARGACLLDLAIMPGLAPCYVATERALVVGWNPTSVRRALDARAGDSPSLGERAGDSPALGAASAAVIRLDRIAAADRILAGAQPSEPQRREYPWRAITATGAREGGGYRLRLRFEAGRSST